MNKFSVSLALTILYVLGCVLAVPEKVEHGSHGAEKHKSLHFKGKSHNAAYDLDALLGSYDVEELSELPEEVRKNRLTNLAKAHDTNNNGRIEEEELMEWVLNSFRLLDRQEADETRRDEDEDKDGKISFHEILKKRYAYTKQDVEDLEKRMQSGKFEQEDSETFEMVDEDKRRFAAADVNNDGLLDEDEFIAFYQPYDHPHMHSLEMERAMKEHDENKDGVVEMQEFMKGKMDDEEDRLAEITNFENLDKDKDGKLTVDEFKPWILLDNTEIAKDEVEHLIKECDENEDGHLTIEEIIEKEESFLESQATDYGRHLHFVKDEL